MKTAENIVDQNFRSDYWLDRMMIINSAAKNIVIEAMEEYADQYKSKWISVTERLPELGTRVEVYSDRDGNNFATYNTDNVWGLKDQKGNPIPCFLDEQDEQPSYWIVTHWRLPQIPE